MWSSIQWITGGATLAAFLAACGVAAYRSKLSHDENVLRSAPESERDQLMLAKWGAFRIDTDKLSKEQRYKLAIEQVRTKSRQSKAVLGILAFIAFLLFCITVYAIAKAHDPKMGRLHGVIEEKNHQISILLSQQRDQQQAMVSIVLASMGKSNASETIPHDLKEKKAEISGTRRQLEALITEIDQIEPHLLANASIEFKRRLQEAKKILEGSLSTQIIWFHNVFGMTFSWDVIGTNLVNADKFQPNVPDPWKLVRTEDFDRDGETDFLLRASTTGQMGVWFMTNHTVKRATSIKISDPNFYFVGIGEFNGDGTSDILWRHNTADRTMVWFMKSTGITNFTYDSVGWCPGIKDTSWRPSAIGDFNHDGKADIVWRNQENGKNQVWLMNGTNLVAAVPIQGMEYTDWQIVATGDFNGEGHTDLVWHNSKTFQNAVWFLGGEDGLKLVSTSLLPSRFLPNWVIVGVSGPLHAARQDAAKKAGSAIRL